MVDLSKVASQRDDFLTERRKSFGGSDLAPFLIGLNAQECSYSSPMAVVAIKRGERNGVIEPNNDMLIGTAAEPAVIAIFEREYGKKVTQLPLTIRHQSHPHSHANVDGVITEERDGVLYITHVFEAKTTGRMKEYLPDGYDLQVRHYMAVLSQFEELECGGQTYKIDLEGAIVFMLAFERGKPTRMFEVGYSPEDAQEILDYEEFAWQHYVVEGEFCMPSGSSTDTEIIAARYGYYVPETITDRPDLVESVDLFVELSEQIKDLTAQKESLKQEIQISLAGCSKATSGDFLIKNTEQRKSSFQKKKLMDEHPEFEAIIGKYTTESTSSRFEIVKKKEKK